MKFKKIICLLTIAATGASMLVGCGGNKEAVKNEGITVDENVTSAGELPVVKETVKLTVGIPGTSKVENYDTNAFTKFLEEKTGIDIEFYEFPSSGGTEKLNVMLASGTELPDVVVGIDLSKTTFEKYKSEGTFVNLAPYIEKYGYWIKEMEEKTEVKYFNSFMTSADGGKYFMPNVSEQTGNVYGGKAFINKKWLDKLGLDMPETIDDFKNVMHAFITQDPNGNGKNDEIGFTGSKDGWNEKPINFLVNSFIYDDYANGYVLEDGKVSLNYQTPEYKEAIKYLSDMVAAGELDIQCLTQGSDTLRSICASETPVVGAFATGSPDVLFGDNKEVLADYVALPPLKGPNGIAYALKDPSTVACGGFITKYCEHPAAAFRFLDYFLSEEASIFGRYGVEGTDWIAVDESVPCIFESIGAKSRIKPILAYGAIQNSHWNQFNPSFRSKDISDSMAWDGDPLNGEYVKGQALAAYYNKGPEDVLKKKMVTLSEEDMAEFDELYNSIYTYVNEQTAFFISGKMTVDKDWDKFMKELDNLGVNRYIELLQTGYDNFIKNK